MARAADGAVDALGMLYDRHGRLAYSSARRICAHDGLAEDVVVEVLLSPWRDPRRFDANRGRFSSRLLTAVHHRAVELLRRKGSDRRQTVPDARRDAGGSVPADRAGLAALDTLAAGDVRDALDQLPRDQRRVIALAYYGGYTQPEVAAITGVPLGTVTTRMYNGVRRLRGLLTPTQASGKPGPETRRRPVGVGRGCANVEQAVAWALRALEPADEGTLLEHLPGCPVCREAARQTEDLVWAMAAGDEQVEPRPQLRDKVMAAVAATPQTPVDQREKPWPELAPRPPEDGAGTGAGTGDRTGPVVGGSVAPPPWNPVRPTVHTGAAERAEARRRSARRRRHGVLVATVVLAVVGIVGITIRQFGGAQQQQQAQAHAAEARRVLAELEQPGGKHAVLNALSGEPIAGVLLSGGQRQVASVSLRPNNTARTTYVLWGIGEGRPVPVGTFDVALGDHSLHPVGNPLPAGDPFRGYAISVENGRGAPQSPGMVVATGQVAN